MADCGHTSTISQSLHFILSLRINSSFITSRPVISRGKIGVDQSTPGLVKILINPIARKLTVPTCTVIPLTQFEHQTKTSLSMGCHLVFNTNYNVIKRPHERDSQCLHHFLKAKYKRVWRHSFVMLLEWRTRLV